MEKENGVFKKTQCRAYIIQIILLLAEVFLNFHRFDNKTWRELEIFYIFKIHT